jgi:hypothetical protein
MGGDSRRPGPIDLLGHLVDPPSGAMFTEAHQVVQDDHQTVPATGHRGCPADDRSIEVSAAFGPGEDGVAEGEPNDVGDVNVYRIGTGGALTTVASDFTMIGDIAFDSQGRLLVLEIDTARLGDPSPIPSLGALIRVNADGTRTTLASAGLLYPLGLAVAGDGTIYVSNDGVLAATGSPVPGARCHR